MEQIPTNPERREEPLSLEEIKGTIEEILGGKDYEEIKKEYDEEGLYIYEVGFKTPEGTTELSYKRGGSLDRSENPVDVIHWTEFNNDGFPLGGYALKKRINGEWITIGE